MSDSDKEIANQSDYFNYDTSVPVALFREEGMKVYARYEKDFVPGLQLMNLDCNANGEVVVYDFAKYRDYAAKGQVETDFVDVDGNACIRYIDVSDIPGEEIFSSVVETIGACEGTLLYPSWLVLTSTDWHAHSGLARVHDADGKMIYYPEKQYYANRYDINRDLLVDISDLDIIINAVIGKKLIDNMKEAADVNYDKEVDISDANKVINAILGK